MHKKREALHPTALCTGQHGMMLTEDSLFWFRNLVWYRNDRAVIQGEGTVQLTYKVYKASLEFATHEASFLVGDKGLHM